ncbi:MAG: LptF/LptG family permease [Planctomycetes bacterium]|nr:LptF/LptG family permease [Planctomycetota bacterium]
MLKPKPRLLVSTLDIYVLKRYVAIYGANLVSFTLLFVLIDMISHFEEFARKADGFGDLLGSCARYYAAVTPLIFCQVLGPVVSVSAALFAVTTFQRSNELTPILATGRSLQRTFAPILAASFLVSSGVFLIQEEVIPRTVSAIREAVETREASTKEKHVVHLDSKNGILVVFREYDRLARRASGVDVVPMFPGGGNQLFIRAREAEWIAPAFATGDSLAGYWLVRDGSLQEYNHRRHLVIKPPPPDRPAGEDRLAETFAEMPLETEMRPADVELRRDEAVYMTLAELRRKAATSPDHTGWSMKYLSRFAYPAINFILVLLGLPVIVGFGTRNVFFGALLALGISTAYFVANSVCQDLGIRGRIPVSVGATIAPFAFTALGAVLYRRMRS